MAFKPSDRLRLILALVAPPILTSALAPVIYTLLTGCFGSSCTASLFGLAMSTGGFFGLIIGVPIAIMFGLPAHHWLSRARQTHIGAYCAAGALAGLPGAIAMAFAGFDSVMITEPGVWVTGLGLAAAIGSLSAALVWLIRRPDGDAGAPM